MKIVIWGVGVRGKMVFSRLKSEEVIAFIDSDINKVGTEYEGKKIIDFQEYVKSYSQYYILISVLRSEPIKKELDEKGIYKYWDLLDCPAELQGAEYKHFDKYISSLAEGKSYGVYGTTFYSLFFYYRLKEGSYKEVYLIPELSIEEKKENALLKSFDNIEIIHDSSQIRSLDKIFVTIDNSSLMELPDFDGIKCEDVFDLIKKIPYYKNPELVKFKDIHKNERCFIVATGPSLTVKDLDILKDNGEKTISMNRVYLVFGQTDWRPDYLVIADRRYVKGKEEQIKSIPVDNIFISDLYQAFWEKEVPNNIYKFHDHPSPVSKGLPGFSDDFIYGAYGCGTVTYECIQLAVYMGFKEIYLIGVDFRTSSNYKDSSNHFIPHYHTEASQSEGAFFLDKEATLAYKAAKKYAEEHGVNIYNATRGGCLEVFKRKNFDEVIKGK